MTEREGRTVVTSRSASRKTLDSRVRKHELDAQFYSLSSAQASTNRLTLLLSVPILFPFVYSTNILWTPLHSTRYQKIRGEDEVKNTWSWSSNNDCSWCVCPTPRRCSTRVSRSISRALILCVKGDTQPSRG